MKKLKYLIVMVALIFSFSINVLAEEKTLTTDAKGNQCNGSDCVEKIYYTITLKSDKLLDNMTLSTNTMYDEITHLEDTYKISGIFYGYQLKDELGNVVNNLDDEVEILIADENLVENTKYNVYYLDKIEYPKQMDKQNIGDKAEVVKIDGKLYIKLVTSTLKSFILEREISQEYKQKFEEVSEDGYFIFPAIKPQKTSEMGFDFYTFFQAYAKGNDKIKISPLEEYEIDKEFSYMTLEFNDLPGERHVVKYKWQYSETPKEMAKKVKEIEKNIKNNTKSLKELIGRSGEGVYFEVEDLGYLNYLYNSKETKHEEIVSYSMELRKIFNHNNFKYHFDFRAGAGMPFSSFAFGYMLLEYDSLLYAIDCEAGGLIKSVLYIPESTKDSDEEYIKALQKRIEKYFGTSDFKIEVAGSRAELEKENPDYKEYWGIHFNEEKLTDSYFNVTINGRTEQFLIEKNDSKIKEIEFITKDLKSDVEVNSTSGSVPLDTLIDIDIIGKNHKEFKEILEILKKQDGMIYDIKLYSESLNKYITKLDNGKFKVKIPLKEEFKNKKLKAYYIGDDNKIEEYNINIEDGYAVFETDHFSTYTIAESNEEEVPNTFDGIYKYIGLLVISLMGLLSINIFSRKKNI